MNSLIQPYVVGVQAAVSCPLYDAREARANRARFRRDAIPLLDRANSIHIPIGRWPTRGWFLVAREDYDKLDTYVTNFQLEIGDPAAPNNVAALKNLSVVQAQCATRGLASDPKALYLVEVTDGRGLLHNEWFQAPLTAAYNIRAPAYPQTFMPHSMNGGTTWTWATMLADMWGNLPTVVGAWPGLPSGIAPAGTPEGFWFTGVPAWSALCDVLDHLGLAVACDLTLAAPFTVVDSGAADATFAARQATYAANLEDDLEWIDTGSGRVPATVRVLFRRRNSVYGSEETVTYRDDAVARQWGATPYYAVTVDAPSSFARAVGEHHLWSDFTVRYDDDGNPLAADVVAATTIAQERVSQYFGKIYDQTAGSMTRTYAGALPFTTGSRVDGVKYYMDCADPDSQGWRTQLVRGGCAPPWPDIWD